MESHHKRCNGERTYNGKKKCKICIKWISKANFASHRISCGASDKELSGLHNSSTKIWRTSKEICRKRNKMITVANMARHQQSKACL